MSSIKCGECDLRKSTVFCEKCDVYFCEICSENRHSKQATRFHSIVPVAGINGTLGFRICPEHQQKMTVFDEVDLRIVCPSCVQSGKRAGHPTKPIREAFPARRSELQSQLRTFMQKKAVVEDSCSGLHVLKSQLTTKSSQIRADVSKTCDELIRIIEARRTAYFNRLAVLEKQKLERIDKSIKKAEIAKNALGVIVGAGQSLLEKENQTDFLSGYSTVNGMIQGGMPDLPSVEVPRSVEYPLTFRWKEAKDLLANIWIETEADDSTFMEPIGDETRVGKLRGSSVTVDGTTPLSPTRTAILSDFASDSPRLGAERTDRRCSQGASPGLGLSPSSRPSTGPQPTDLLLDPQQGSNGRPTTSSGRCVICDEGGDGEKSRHPHVKHPMIEMIEKGMVPDGVSKVVVTQTNEPAARKPPSCEYECRHDDTNCFTCSTIPDLLKSATPDNEVSRVRNRCGNIVQRFKEMNLERRAVFEALRVAHEEYLAGKIPMEAFEEAEHEAKRVSRRSVAQMEILQRELTTLDKNIGPKVVPWIKKATQHRELLFTYFRKQQLDRSSVDTDPELMDLKTSADAIAVELDAVVENVLRSAYLS